MKDLLLIVLPSLVTSVVTAFITKYVFSRKYNAEALTIEAQAENVKDANFKAAMDGYNVALNSLKNQLDSANKRIDELTLELKSSRENFLEREVDLLHKLRMSDEKIAQLETKVAQLILKVCIVPECRQRQMEGIG